MSTNKKPSKEAREARIKRLFDEVDAEHKRGHITIPIDGNNLVMDQSSPKIYEEQNIIRGKGIDRDSIEDTRLAPDYHGHINHEGGPNRKLIDEGNIDSEQHRQRVFQCLARVAKPIKQYRINDDGTLSRIKKEKK